MRILFLTTYNVDLEHEHFFTINVWQQLVKTVAKSSSNEIMLATILLDANRSSFSEVSEVDGVHYHLLHINAFLSDDQRVSSISGFFSKIKPDIIHSNMIEGFDVQAAYDLKIPICLTIHIGGFVCPRGGGNGFLRYDDTICNQPIGEECVHCSSCDMPLPAMTYFLYKLLPHQLIDYVDKSLKRNVFYLTPFLLLRRNITNRKKVIGIFKHATLIAANNRLVHLLKLNGLSDNVVLIPHGVKRREKLVLPPVTDVVRFFFLGRIQYSKGLHVAIKALEGLNQTKYEFHIIGDAGMSRTSQRYFNHVQHLAKGKNVIFHGRLPNESIESVIKSMHVLVFPTILLEVYGITIAEVLSIGRPVLATKCGGSEMQIKDGVNGWLVEPNDVQQLHERLKYLLDNTHLIQKTYNSCHLPFSVVDYADELVKLYQQIIAKN